MRQKRALKSRISEHENSGIDIVVGKHVIDCRHSFDFDNASILDLEPFFMKRLISEMIYIRSHKDRRYKISKLLL